MRTLTEEEEEEEDINTCSVKTLKENTMALHVHSKDSLPTIMESSDDHMTTKELEMLMDKAINFIHHHDPAQRVYMKELKFFYRNKPQTYWEEEVMQNSGIMEPYKKDKNGDQRSPINDNIKGLFFSAIPGDRGMPLQCSPFGSWRFNVPVDCWMKDCSTRLYFTDFYCNSSYSNRWHYVTLVMTAGNVNMETFCEKKLIEIDKLDNPFLRIVDGTVCASTKVHVELLYTEAIDIQEYGDYTSYTDLEFVPSQGTSRPGGLPKYRSCTHCNLTPIDYVSLKDMFQHLCI